MKTILKEGQCKICRLKFLVAGWQPHRAAGFCRACALIHKPEIVPVFGGFVGPPNPYLE